MPDSRDCPLCLGMSPEIAPWSGNESRALNFKWEHCNVCWKPDSDCILLECQMIGNHFLHLECFSPLSCVVMHAW